MSASDSRCFACSAFGPQACFRASTSMRSPLPGGDLNVAADVREHQRGAFADRKRARKRSVDSTQPSGTRRPVSLARLCARVARRHRRHRRNRKLQRHEICSRGEYPRAESRCDSLQLLQLFLDILLKGARVVVQGCESVRGVHRVRGVRVRRCDGCARWVCASSATAEQQASGTAMDVIISAVPLRTLRS